MGDKPTTDNKAAEIFDTVLKDAETIGDAAAESVAITYLPFLGWPIIRPLFEMALHWVSGSMTKALELQGTFWIIKFQTTAERDSAQSTLLKLQQDAKARADAGTISKDEQAWIDAVDNFIKSDGSATPK